MAKLLLLSPNVIGKAMAGPSIRVMEIAKVLSLSHEVIVAAPNTVEDLESLFPIVQSKTTAFKKALASSDFLLTQTLSAPLAWAAKKHGVKIIIDAYDPVPLELLEQFKEQPIPVQERMQKTALANLLFAFKMADGILCASEKQRDLWLGLLLGQHAITPKQYAQDSSLRTWIDVVPFGLPSHVPQQTGPGFREKYNLNTSDKIIIWGGGIWNWFDPESLIQAVKLLSTKRSDIKLVFMGVQNPDPHVPTMQRAHDAMQLAHSLRLINQNVFFNHEWIPYHERHDYLLQADIGASTHFDHLETRFSFRTRMLDYIWTALPILATQGDSFADLIENKQLGITVSPQDPQALAAGIVKLLDESNRVSIKQNLKNLQKEFTWNQVLSPLLKMLDTLSLEPKRRTYFYSFKHLTFYASAKIKAKGIKSCFNKFKQILIKK